MICLYTNIIYHFLFESELTSASERVVREAIIEDRIIPMIVYSELLYIMGAKIVRIKYGVKGKYLCPETLSQTRILRESHRKGEWLH